MIENMIDSSLIHSNQIFCFRISEEGKNTYTVILELNDVVETDAGLYKVIPLYKVHSALFKVYKCTYFYAYLLKQIGIISIYKWLFFSVNCYCKMNLICPWDCAGP